MPRGPIATLQRYIRHCCSSRQKVPRQPLWHVNLVSVTYYSRQYNAAVTTFTQWLEQFPGSPELPQIVFYLASSSFEPGRFAEALPLYQQLLQEAHSPVSAATVYLRLGDCYFFQQQFAAAQQQYQRLLQEFPRTAEALQATYQLGAVALAQKQFDTARQYFQSVVQAKAPPSLFLQAQHALAWVLYHQGQVAQAAGYLRQQRLLATPSAAETVLTQAYELLLLESYQEAIPLLRQAVQSGQDPEREPWLRWLLAQAYAGSGALDQARRVLDEFVERFPQPARIGEIQRWRGDLLLRQRDAAAALQAYRAMLPVAAADEPAERALWTMGEVYQEQRALAEAIAVWQYFLLTFPLSPQRAEVQLRLGAALVQQGAIAQAVALYNDLLRLPLERRLQLQTQWQLAWAHLKGERSRRLWSCLVVLWRPRQAQTSCAPPATGGPGCYNGRGGMRRRARNGAPCCYSSRLEHGTVTCSGVSVRICWR